MDEEENQGCEKREDTGLPQFEESFSGDSERIVPVFDPDEEKEDGSQEKLPDEADSHPWAEQVVEDISGPEPEPEALIKAVIFASPDYVSIHTLKEILGGDYAAATIKQIISGINAKLNEDHEPFEIVEANKSFRFRTRSQYYPWIRKLFKATGARRLSQAALEILALVAYKQPITKAEIEDIRGVSVDGVLKGLLDRKLIAILGTTDKIGNAFNYGTTKEFLQYFGINRIPQDLPKLSEFENLVNSTALLPQISRDGEMTQGEQNEVDEEPEL
ncbi:SMC-Scp complex subunit ScpB [Fibrobacterota bacterium]